MNEQSYIRKGTPKPTKVSLPVNPRGPRSPVNRGAELGFALFLSATSHPIPAYHLGLEFVEEKWVKGAVPSFPAS